MNKAMLFSVASLIGLIGFSLAAAVTSVPAFNPPVFAVLIVAALMCAVAWRYFLNVSREGR